MGCPFRQSKVALDVFFRYELVLRLLEFVDHLLVLLLDLIIDLPQIQVLLDDDIDVGCWLSFGLILPHELGLVRVPEKSFVSPLHEVSPQLLLHLVLVELKIPSNLNALQVVKYRFDWILINKISVSGQYGIVAVSRGDREVFKLIFFARLAVLRFLHVDVFDSQRSREFVAFLVPVLDISHIRMRYWGCVLVGLVNNRANFPILVNHLLCELDVPPRLHPVVGELTDVVAVVAPLELLTPMLALLHVLIVELLMLPFLALLDFFEPIKVIFHIFIRHQLPHVFTALLLELLLLRLMVEKSLIVTQFFVLIKTEVLRLEKLRFQLPFRVVVFIRQVVA